MAKILTDRELGEIVQNTIRSDMARKSTYEYKQFLDDLADLICTHFGGVNKSAVPPDSDLPWTVAVYRDESVPPDGGVYAKYDPDENWSDS